MCERAPVVLLRRWTVSTSVCVWMGVSRLKRHSLFVCLSVLVNQHDPDLQRMSLTAPAIRVFSSNICGMITDNKFMQLVKLYLIASWSL